MGCLIEAFGGHVPVFTISDEKSCKGQPLSRRAQARSGKPVVSTLFRHVVHRLKAPYIIATRQFA